jgi:hypothetical protein
MVYTNLKKSVSWTHWLKRLVIILRDLETNKTPVPNLT